MINATNKSARFSSIYYQSFLKFETGFCKGKYGGNEEL